MGALDDRSHDAMTEARWIRLAAVAGAVFALLILVAGPVLGRSSPNLSASGQTTFDFIRGHRTDIQLTALLGALAMGAFVIWLSGLFGALRHTTDGYPGLAVAAVGGGALAASTSVVSQAIKATTACQITAIGPRNVQVFYTLVKFTNGGVLVGLTVVIGMTAAACLSSSMAGRWFVILSCVLAVGSLLGATSVAYAGSAPQQIGKLFLSLDTAWVLIVSVLFWRRPTIAYRGGRG
jgi:hypothetical protein